MAYLVLVRHGLSDYNKKGLWTGWDNPPLAPEGLEQAQKTAQELKDIPFNSAYSSDQIRSVQTLEEILKVINQDLPITQSEKIRERNYGIYTNRNKWDIKKELGDEEFQKLRRSWDYPIPEGESLKEVAAREIPYFESEILPKLKNGENVIIASSGNALRALARYLEDIPEDKISELEIGTGEGHVYEVDSNGYVLKKEIRGVNPNKGKV